ncbi:MAG: SDR family NAD(P)-dependent oxidoreductase [Planktotalea sp.]|uniref:SDR family NAD(P)-dependent oxidoreductase n=1 Tax=Planktotalea sp. TaxID=2029877 RepID=UPI003C77DC64
MKTAIISGGAGGLGRALSAQLMARGWYVIALDIDISALKSTDSLRAVEVDITDASALETAISDAISTRPSIDLVIYNAGVSHIAPFENSSDQAHRRLFEINYFAAINMARLTLVAVRKSEGTHLAISSVAGFSPLFHRTAYAASKHALEGFFASLRSEEKEHGVDSLIAAPSFVGTNIGCSDPDKDGMLRPGSAADGLDYMSPETAAKVILRGYDKRRKFIPVGRIASVAWWINSLSPRLFQRLMERNIKGK